MKTQIEPLGNRILVKLDAAAEKIGSLYIPEAAKETPSQATVIALGQGKLDESGNRQPFDVKVGDRVLVSKYGGTEVKLDGVGYKLLTADDVIAKLK